MFERKDSNAVVRIHDDFCEERAEPCVARAAQILSSARRRKVADGKRAADIPASQSRGREKML